MMSGIADRIMDYEEGELAGMETVELFRDLAGSGVINHLQGHYGRTLHDMVKAGLIRRQAHTWRIDHDRCLGAGIA